MSTKTKAHHRSFLSPCFVSFIFLFGRCLHERISAASRIWQGKLKTLQISRSMYMCAVSDWSTGLITPTGSYRLVSRCHCGALTVSESCGSTQNITALAFHAHDSKVFHFTVILRLVWTRRKYMKFFIRCSCGLLHTFPDVYRETPIMLHLIPNDIIACKLLR